MKRFLFALATILIPAPLFAQTITIPAQDITVPAQTITIPSQTVPLPPAPSGNGLKTVLDFGAACDDTTDDADEIEAALRWSEANDAPVHGVSRTCRLARGITVVTTKTHGKKWGLQGNGMTLRADYNDPAQNFIDIRARHYARFLTINNVTLRGNRTHGHGLYLGAREAPGVGGSLYNAEVAHVAIEGFLDGFHIEGEFFESHLTNVHGRDNTRDGFSFGHGPNQCSGPCGIFSDTHLSFFTAGQNGRYGVRTREWATDLVISHGYILTNQDAGLFLQNGIDKGVHQVGFENNCLAFAFNETCAHIVTTNKASFTHIRGYSGMATGAKYLIRKQNHVGGDMSILSAALGRSGTQPSVLVKLSGGGHTIIRHGSTAEAFVVESPATWTCEYCKGPGLSNTSVVSNLP